MEMAKYCLYHIGMIGSFSKLCIFPRIKIARKPNKTSFKRSRKIHNEIKHRKKKSILEQKNCLPFNPIFNIHANNNTILFWITHQTRQLGTLSKRDMYCQNGLFSVFQLIVKMVVSACLHIIIGMGNWEGIGRKRIRKKPGQSQKV